MVFIKKLFHLSNFIMISQMIGVGLNYWEIYMPNWATMN